MTRWIARTLLVAACVLGVGLPDGAARAQDYPNRAIKVIVPFVPGGSSDVVARIMAAKMSETLGQQLVVDNRAGAGGTLGADIAAKSTPDGYTWIWGSDASITINPVPGRIANGIYTTTFLAGTITSSSGQVLQQGGVCCVQHGT